MARSESQKNLHKEVAKSSSYQFADSKCSNLKCRAGWTPRWLLHRGIQCITIDIEHRVKNHFTETRYDALLQFESTCSSDGIIRIGLSKCRDQRVKVTRLCPPYMNERSEYFMLW